MICILPTAITLAKLGIASGELGKTQTGELACVCSLYDMKVW